MPQATCQAKPPRWLPNTRLQTDVALVNICLALELCRCQASPGAAFFGRACLG
jgi:hypothetical protein